ncbi:MAG: (d)CMP kinase [Deferribacteraceae bacterium]|jgi:cytidylate kinase|nr:(d)CMP kinase [Deferribacteraceae bacterium]
MQVAVDGPASSGKSTISKILASEFSLIYLDTGAMYRAGAYLKLKYKIIGEPFYELLRRTDFIFVGAGKPFVLKSPNRREDVSAAIRTPEVTAATSDVAADGEVRRILTAKQQKIAEGADIIMDGRDIGTVVLPNADIKFFLIASSEERARRRTIEWRVQGKNVIYEDVLKDISERDKHDISRENAPLKKAPDAKEIDTTLLTIDEVVEIMRVCIREIAG